MAKTRKRIRPKRKRTQEKSTISPVLIGVVVVAALLIVGGLILLGNQGRPEASGPVDVSQFPAMGEADAPVTLIEYSDYG